MMTWIHSISSPLLREMLLLMRVDRPIGTWLLLWPALWSLTAAQQGRPDPGLVLIFIVGSFVMRSAGCVANDIIDRRIDPHILRTRNRPLSAGRVSLDAARLLLLGLLLIAFVLVMLLDPLVIQLAFIGAIFALTYPFVKRFIHLPQLYLGVAFGWGGIMAWAAATGEIPAEAWLFFIATLSWTAGYDTIYGMMDRNEDLKIGVKSMAILFGRHDVMAVACLYATALLSLFAAGVTLHLNPPFFLALMIAQWQMAWQIIHIRTSSSETQTYDQTHIQKQSQQKAFLSNAWTGLIILIGLGLQ